MKFFLEDHEAAGTVPEPSPVPLASRPRSPLGPSRLGRGPAAVTCMLLMALLLPPTTGHSADLFTPVTGTPPSSLPSDDPTLRSRVVTMDLEQIRRARAAAASSGRPRYSADAAAATGSAATVATALTLNLFEDVVVTGQVEHTAPTYSGGYSISGHLVEEPLGTMTLVVNGETVAGTVRRLGATYQILSVGEGLYAISEVEESPLHHAAEVLHSVTGRQH